MPSKRTLLGAAAFSAALAGGGIAGAVLGTPNVSGAQDTTSTTTQDAGTDAKAPDGTGRHGPHPRLGMLKEAAEALGMEPADLRQELAAGKSIADVAEERGVSEQKVIDAIVSAGTERLQQAIDELPDHAKEAVEREGLPQRPDRPARG